MEVDIKVKDVMVKDVASVAVPGSRDDLLRLLREKQVSGVPAVKNGTLVGIVTRVDLLQQPEEEQIALLMTRDPITIGPDESISDAARSIISHKIRRLPVVEDDKLIGILTTADIIRVIGDLDIKEPVEKFLNNGVIAIWDETPLSVVGKIMELSVIAAAPLINKDLELSGILTDRDLINATIIEDSIEKSDMSSGSDEDAWTWESVRDTMKIYYGVSKISLPDTPVRDIMVKDLITEFYGAETSDCAQIMVKHNIDQIPIINANYKLTGLLRDRDLLKSII
ncbi:MAG: CBS domain-containing protein [Halobacteriota archaeon]|nr:CBS domain-containing protein [Halobacteriota archaeon]